MWCPCAPVRCRLRRMCLTASEWSLAKAVLHAEDPANYASWVQGLERAGRAGGRLVLKAPSRFHANYVMSHLMPRLLAACRDVDGGVSAIVVEA